MQTTSGTDPNSLFRQALQMQQSGQFGNAIHIYRQLLDQFPDDAGLLCQLGTALLQAGQPGDGIPHLRRAVKIAPAVPMALANLATALHQTGRSGEALGYFERVAALDPNAPRAHNNLGNILRDLGRARDAIARYDRAIALAPDYGEAYYNRADTLYELGETERALTDFDRAILLRPQMVEARINRSTLLCDVGQTERALADCDAVIEMAPHMAQGYNNRGNVLLMAKRPNDALADFDTALEIAPDYSEAHSNRGNALIELNRHTEALAAFDMAIAAAPGNAQAYYNRAGVQISLDLPENALADLDRALELAPDTAEYHLNRGYALRALARHAEALDAFHRARTLNPTRDTTRSDASFNAALGELQLGHFATGWPLYEARWNNVQLKKHDPGFSEPRWQGEDIHDKTILVYAEQGMGDVIQFSRYCPMVAARAGKVLFLVHPSLNSLMTTLPGTYEIVSQQPPPFDVQVPLMSLPLIFGTTATTIPAEVPYLSANAERAAAWDQRLGEKTRPRIGLVWSGNPSHLQDSHRSIAIAAIARLLDLPFDFHALQKVIRTADRIALRDFPQLTLHEDALEDFADTAALASQMDLVISVDTAVAHMAGAIGKPLWLLIPYSADWRWLTGRNDSPWYPTAKLFRQPVLGDWQTPLDIVRAELIHQFAVQPTASADVEAGEPA